MNFEKDISQIHLAVFTDRGPEWSQVLHSHGIEVGYFPLITFSPIDNFHEDLLRRWRELLGGSPGYLLFTSPRAVDYFAKIILSAKIYPTVSSDGNKRNKKFSRVITVGPSTLAALKNLLGQYGLKAEHNADLEGSGQGQRGVWNLISTHELQPIIHIRPRIIDDFLEKQFKNGGYEPYPIYETRQLRVDDKVMENILCHDYLLFTSPSMVSAFQDNIIHYSDMASKKLGGKKLPPALLIGESSHKAFQKAFQEIKKKTKGYLNLTDWKAIPLLPGNELSERIIKTLFSFRISS